MLLPLLVESFTYNDRTDEGSPTPDCRQHSVVDSDWRFEKLRRCRLQGQKDFYFYNPQDIPGEGQKRTPLILIVHKPSR